MWLAYIFLFLNGLALVKVLMEYREFGRTGVKVSAIGMGTYYDPTYIAAALLFRYHHDRDKKIAALKKGLELGVNLIDTAEIYQTEPIVADADSPADVEMIRHGQIIVDVLVRIDRAAQLHLPGAQQRILALRS
jgi:diketogulonate reductase-like aldo/keto reductase